ncbi:MAG: twin-arginine translocase subunit TatB [Proteobacteria bacterium]|nr:twin-arginine translocase subunit TatB [Pseudomonadota bacterium]
MSGIGFSEIIILCLIGLIVLGPERLPRVANQIGGWVGQARRMTRMMRRQLEEELNFDKDFNIKPTIHQTPNDDDSYSPLHSQPARTVAGVEIEDRGKDDGGEDDMPDDDSAEKDNSERKTERSE